MNATLTPANTAELVEAVRSTPRVIAVGAGTKPRLSAVNATRISTAKLSGMVEYEPSEFTFTALAGTPVREIAATLAARGQYLPFDPMLVDAGATLGGTVASGVSGPGRFRFGGLRDFILAVQFVDGAGRLLRMGGKVVKNAAGFDLPKFLVGSLGRFGVLAEVTFKVFPRPTSRLTVMLEARTPEVATQILTQAPSARWEIDALDWLPDGNAVIARLVGPAESLDALAEEILKRWPGEKLSAGVADKQWNSLSEFGWVKTLVAGNAPAKPALLVKVPTTPDLAATLRQTLEGLGGRVHLSAGGSVAFAAFAADADIAGVDGKLHGLKLPGLTLHGDAPVWLGVRHDFKIAAAVKVALDAENRFPSLANCN
jgi:glycolate oxidase FAD binding subunit